ncbi:putative UDP-glucuronosyl/UDP-glucosyltransferase, UDP-glycosyltransferase family [Helianthus annuus]|nr:putative UDP-glucuronosyl/UDP-glucosyltransferase, UDP-glycosyltransferase family [Helianthus annuus]
MNSSCEQKQNINVLLVTLSAQGHLNPILKLGKILVNKGLHVTLATTNSALKNMSSAPNSIGGVHHEFFSDGLPIDYNRKANMDYYMDTLSKFGPVNLLALIKSHPRKFACVIHTPFVPWVSDVAAEWVLGNSFMELEKDVIMSLNNGGCVFWPVGPLVPATLMGKEEDVGFDLFKSNEDSNCMEWLNKQKPSSVVYVSFGTLLFLTEKDIKNIASGLKTTKRPFLWVIRVPENQELPKHGFLEEIKEQGLIVSWCPQTQVLSHPAVGCFLSHCGWNSLLESVVAGTPVIACPQWTDQPTNAKLVTDVWGVGVKVKKSLDGVVSGEEVGRCVEEVMSGLKSEVIRKNALELKAAARVALRDGGSSDNNIRMFVDEVVSSCSCTEHK